jgi:hypothetical protein
VSLLMQDRRASSDENVRAAVGVLVVVLGTALVLAGFLIRRSGDPAACEPLARRYAELSLRAVDEHAPPSAVQSAEIGMITRANDLGALKDCKKHLTRDAQLCAESAPTVDEFERCFP